MDENPEDVAVDTNTDVEETTNSNENVEVENVDNSEEVERLQKANAQILARAKRAEEENKRLKSTPTQQPINNNPQLSEELKLIARGLSDEEIDQAKVIAKGKGVPLTEAIKDPLFVIYQGDLKEKQRKEEAKLGASKGSGEAKESELIKSDMTREEHQAVFKKVMGK